MQWRMTTRIVLTGLAAFVLPHGSAWAQAIPPGTYAIPESGYSIEVLQTQGDEMDVVEAGKSRTYRRAGPGTYEYASPITGATYQLIYRDHGSVTAMKKNSGNAPTLLMRAGGPAPEDPPASAVATVPVPPSTPPVAPASAPSPQLAIAERYQQKALTDKDDVQTWAFCSAAALKRAMASGQDADAYGREAAARLASISVDPSRNPCPDAIPDALWPGADRAADAASVQAANAAQKAAAQAQAAQIAAMRAQEKADQETYQRARAEHEAALARTQAEQVRFARQQADYEAALARHAEAVKAAQPR